MNKNLRIPILAVVCAIAVNAAMDAVGLSEISFASLLPVVLVVWAFDRSPRRDMGIAFGRLRHYVLAIAHPVLIVGAIALVCLATGALDTSQTDWIKSRESFFFDGRDESGAGIAH